MISSDEIDHASNHDGFCRVSSTLCNIPANAIIHRVKPGCSLREKTQDLKTIEFMGTLFCEGRDEG